MKICTSPQGSIQWLEDRAGVITASMFFECRKRLKSGPNKGDFTVSARQYAFKLACERISGSLLDDVKFDTWQMKRGRELESDARFEHEFRKGILVEQAGFVISDNGLYGASVDGLINHNGNSEYKCFVSPLSLMPILLDGDISSCIDQVQGGMWITEREYCDFCLYCPALENIGRDLEIFTIYRDQEYIDGLEKDLAEFNDLVEHYRKTLTNHHSGSSANDSSDENKLNIGAA